MKIVVTGYYGFSNYGDELFIIASKILADKYWNSHELLFISPPIDNINAKYIVPEWFSKKLYGSFNFFGKISRLVFLLIGLIRSDVILNAGGSTISSNSSLFKFRLQKLMKFLFRKKIYAVGLSLGPFNSAEDEKLARVILDDFTCISLRDEKSSDFALKIGLKNFVKSVDLVGVIADQYKFHKFEKQENIISISLMDIDSKILDIYEIMEKTLFFAKKKNMIVEILVLNTHPINGDTDISNIFMTLLRNHEVKYRVVLFDNNSLELWEHIAKSSLLISCRLHGAICAYLSNVPFYLYEYHEKCSEFLKEIEYTNNSLETIFKQQSIPMIDINTYINKSIKNSSVLL